MAKIAQCEPGFTWVQTFPVFDCVCMFIVIQTKVENMKTWRCYNSPLHNKHHHLIWEYLFLFSIIPSYSITIMIILCTGVCVCVFTVVVRGASRERSTPAPAVRLGPGSPTPLHGPPDNSLIPGLKRTQRQSHSGEHFIGKNVLFILFSKNLSCMSIL